MKTLSKILFITSILFAISSIGYVLYPPLVPISPLIEFLTPTKSSLELQNKYLILGFLPYWNLKKVSSDALSVSTDLAYFALRLSPDGSLMTHVNRREQEPGYTNYTKLLDNQLISHDKLVLTFVQKDEDALRSFLTNPVFRKRAASTIVSKVTESGAIGINIDFEPLGDSDTLSPLFTQFMKDLKAEIAKQKLSLNHLSVSLYPSAAARPRMWNIKELDPLIDYFVVMSYDYTLPGNSKTGPNSPLRGAGQLFEHDILTNLAEFTSVISSRKILLGIPFYGYEWDTSDETKYTATLGRGSLASLERIQKLVDENTLELLWDRNSLTPYAIRKEEGKVISQIYFEDINSIKLKLDLVRQANLGGIAIWALGYEGNNRDLWDTIKHQLLLVL